MGGNMLRRRRFGMKVTIKSREPRVLFASLIFVLLVSLLGGRPIMLDLVSSLNVATHKHVVRWDVTGDLRCVRLCHVTGVRAQLASKRP